MDRDWLLPLLNDQIWAPIYNNSQLSSTITMHNLSKREQSDLAELIEKANLALLQCLQSSPDRVKKQQEQKPNESVKQQTHQVEKQMQQLSIFDKIEDFYIDESLEPKITNLKYTQFTPRRKDELFKRFKKDQQEKLISRKKNAEKNYNLRDSVPRLTKGEFNLRNETLNKTETFPVTADDIEKLRPDTDLNDTIVGNYLKLLQFVFLPSEIDQKCTIFSSFFLEKLINQYVKEESIFEKDSSVLVEEIRAKVKENYKNVKRWTKKIDIFEKEILVFPINAFRHWYCILVLRPNSLLTNNPKCQVVFCDSMFEKRDYIVEAIRKYVQYELQERKNIKIDLNQTTAPCYQLLLPRQTNNHDCGLYMLSYIEQLLMNFKFLDNLSTIKNRRKLNLFPRTLIYTMRERVKNLFIKLINAKQEQKNEILAEYKGEKQRIINEEKDLSDFDTINEREYKKYEKMNIAAISGATQEEKCFNCEIKFYLDTEINYYEKDK